jgi:hypothetical protein
LNCYALGCLHSDSLSPPLELCNSLWTDSSSEIELIPSGDLRFLRLLDDIFLTRMQKERGAFHSDKPSTLYITYNFESLEFGVVSDCGVSPSLFIYL